MTSFAPRRVDRRDMFALAALVVAGVGIPLGLAVAAGTIGIPSNDDWVYMRGADSLFRTGSINTASGVSTLTWYDSLWSSFRPCAVLSNSPLRASAGFTLIRLDRSAYRQYLFFGPEEPLYLYGSEAPGCPTPPRTIAARKPLAGRAYTAAVSPGSGIGARGSGEAGAS